MSNRYIAHLEKQSNLAIAAAGTHLGQNAITKYLLQNKSTGKYLGKAFNEGVHGVVNKSVAAKGQRIVSGALAPDINLIRSHIHGLGEKMAPHLKDLDLKQRAVLHHAVSKGSIPKKYEHYANDPGVNLAYSVARGHAKKDMGVELPHLKQLVGNKELSNLWKSKDHPLLSNVAKNIGSGKPVGKNYKPGSTSPKSGFIGSSLVGVVDPVAGGIDGLKAAMGSKAFNNNKYGGKITHKLEEIFVKNPIKAGHANPDKVGNKYVNFAKDIAINPMSGSLKRTSAALTKAVDKAG